MLTFGGFFSYVLGLVLPKFGGYSCYVWGLVILTFAS